MNLVEKQQQNHLKIAKLKDLPTLPEASCKIITAVNDPDIAIEELTQVISASSALTGRLLGLANSAYFGRAGTIEDLRLAIIQVLGLNLVKGLALSILLSNELDVSACPRFDSEKFWSEGLLTAILAQRFGQLLNNESISPSAAYTSGLLLNIGLLATVYIFPKELNQVFVNVEENEVSLTEEIVNIIGESHFKIGSLLLKRWRLPEMFSSVLLSFENEVSQAQSEITPMVNLLQFSSDMAKAIFEEDEPALPTSLKKLDIDTAKVKKIVATMTEKRDSIRDMAISMTGK